MDLFNPRPACELRAGMTAREQVVVDDFSPTLSAIPTAFGKLVYMASLREDDSSQYEHSGLARRCGKNEATTALQVLQELVFVEWLNYSLERQKLDLEEYLVALPAERGAVLEEWALSTPYVRLPPAGAGPGERRLFQSDLEIILELLQLEHGVDRPASRYASQVFLQLVMRLQRVVLAAFRTAGAAARHHRIPALNGGSSSCYPTRGP